MNHRLHLPLAVIALLIAFATGCKKGGNATVAAPDGGIVIRSNVVNAEVKVNGQLVDPTGVRGLPRGEHLLTATRPGYHDVVKTVSVLGPDTTVDLAFKRLTGFALITSKPSGAEVSVAGDSGVTPFVIREARLGEYRVDVSKPGFNPVMRRLRMNDRTPVHLEIDLASNTGELTINSTPSGARILVDGEYKGLSSATYDSMPAARYKVELEKAGYKPFQTAITISPGGEEVLDIELEALPGSIMVNTRPARARVYINDRFVSVSPAFKKDLPPGAHVIRAEKPGYGVTEEQIILANGQDLDHTITLQKNVGTLLVITEPAGVQVIVDGEREGVTRAAGTDAISAVFTVDNLKQGQHSLQLVKKGYKFEPTNFTIEVDKSTELQEKMEKFFVKDHVVWTGTGKDNRWTGMLVERYPNGDIKMEINPGIYRDFSARDILKEEPYKKGLD